MGAPFGNKLIFIKQNSYPVSKEASFKEYLQRNTN